MRTLQQEAEGNSTLGAGIGATDPDDGYPQDGTLTTA